MSYQVSHVVYIKRCFFSYYLRYICRINFIDILFTILCKLTFKDIQKFKYPVCIKFLRAFYRVHIALMIIKIYPTACIMINHAMSEKSKMYMLNLSFITFLLQVQSLYTTILKNRNNLPRQFITIIYQVFM
ncbi:hypothetical protein D1872_258570 [compost metagenome]